jgi:hypothetical protein
MGSMKEKTEIPINILAQSLVKKCSSTYVIIYCTNNSVVTTHARLKPPRRLYTTNYKYLSLMGGLRGYRQKILATDPMIVK